MKIVNERNKEVFLKVRVTNGNVVGVLVGARSFVEGNNLVEVVSSMPKYVYVAEKPIEAPEAPPPEPEPTKVEAEVTWDYKGPELSSEASEDLKAMHGEEAVAQAMKQAKEEEPEEEEEEYVVYDRDELRELSYNVVRQIAAKEPFSLKPGNRNKEKLISAILRKQKKLFS